MISRLHQQVSDYLTEAGMKFEGHPGPEANLGQILGLTGTNLRLDFLVHTTDGRVFGIEVQSTLHDERGEGAWGRSRDEHLHRLACDDMKQSLLAELGLPCYEVWEFDDLAVIMDLGMKDAVRITRKDIKPKVTNKIASEEVRWEKKPMVNTDFFSPQKLESNSTFSAGQKMTGGSTFKKR